MKELTTILRSHPIINLIDNMNLYNTIVKFYEYQHDYPYVYTRLLTPFRLLTRYVGGRFLPGYLERIHSKFNLSKNRNENLIVSLTSFPLRIDNVWLVVESMFRQTLLPQKIILWLSRNQFPDCNVLPENLARLQGDLFEICFVDGDIRSYKKFLYAFQKYPDSLIVTIDDDLYYSQNLLEKLVNAHKEHPRALICSFAFYFKNAANEVLPCNEWEQIPYGYTEGKDIFFGTGGGTLFQPNLMHPDTINSDLFLKLAPLADDVWMNSMVRLSGLPIIKINYGQYLPIKQDVNTTLTSVNDGENFNDVQINNVAEHYKAKNINIFI